MNTTISIMMIISLLILVGCSNLNNSEINQTNVTSVINQADVNNSLVNQTNSDTGIVNQSDLNNSAVNQTKFETGIYGTITLRTGNCMPTVCPRDGCVSSCYTGPPIGGIYVFDSDILNNRTELIKLMQNVDTRKSITNTSFTKQGFYNVSIAPGSYVLFFKVYSSLSCGQEECSIITVNDSFVHFDEEMNFATD